jgi:hypothetical protein
VAPAIYTSFSAGYYMILRVVQTGNGVEQGVDPEKAATLNFEKAQCESVRFKNGLLSENKLYVSH